MANFIKIPTDVFSNNEIVKATYPPALFQMAGVNSFLNLGIISELRTTDALYENNVIGGGNVNLLDTNVISIESLKYYSIEFKSRLLAIGKADTTPRILDAEVVSWGVTGTGGHTPLNVGVSFSGIDIFKKENKLFIDRSNCPQVFNVGQYIQAKIKLNFGFNAMLNNFDSEAVIYLQTFWEVTGYKQ